MQTIYQTTVKQPISFKGIGLHTGISSKVTILPAEVDSGVTFKRTDLKNNNCIKANYQNVTSAKLCTTLQNKFGVKVSISLYFNKAVSLKVSVPNEFNK